MELPLTIDYFEAASFCLVKLIVTCCGCGVRGRASGVAIGAANDSMVVSALQNVSDFREGCDKEGA